MLLNPLYTAPLPAGFTSGTVEIKSPGTYVDQAGRVQQPSYRFSINADGSLTSLQVGGASSIVGMGVGDRSNAPNVDVVIELRVAGSPVPFRTTYNMVPFDSGSGTLRLQQEKQTAPVIVTASVISNLSNQTALYVMGTENIAIGGTSLAVETFQPVAPVAASASISLVLTGTVNGATYGCVDGANVSTIMATIAAAPDGSTIIIPKGNYVDTGGRKTLTSRNRLKIYFSGSTVKASSGLADPSAGQNGGFYFIGCTEIDVYDGTYDGSLDTRTPYGSDLSGTNLKSGWNILSGCSGVRLHNCFGLRCMMDGIYIGHIDTTITGQPAVTQANMPVNTVLDRCGGDGNYRQGLSVVGCNGLTGQGNRFLNTGKTGGKGTLPMAGVDFEAYVASGYYNYGIDLTDTECNGNTGYAVLFEQGTDSAKLRGVRGTGNGGGLGFADQAKNCEVTGFSLTNSGTIAAEPINLVISGTNNHVRGGTIYCLDGSRAAVIKTNGFLCGVHDVTSTCAVGTLHTGTYIDAGAETQFDNLTAVDGRQTIAGYGVIDMRSTGARLSGQTRVVGYNGDTTSIPVVITQGSATQPSISGYTQPADLRVIGTRLPAVPGLTFIRSSGRAFSLGTVTATLEASTPDRLLYRLSATITTVSGPEAFGVVALSGYSGVTARVLNASANDAGTANPYNAGVLSQPFTAIFAATPSTVQGIQLILLVELTR